MYFIEIVEEGIWLTGKGGGMMLEEASTAGKMAKVSTAFQNLQGLS